MAVNKRLLQGAAAGGFVPSENFKAVTYTGDGTSSQFIDVGFTPDFVWIKGRNTSDYHNLIDSSRTAGCFLNSNTTGVEDCNASHAQIQTGGFNAKGNPNANGINYVAWCWKANGGTTSSNTDGSVTSTVQANQDAGFSIVKYTGTGSNATIGHGLSAAPEMMMIKNLDQADAWVVYHSALGTAEWMSLNETFGATGTGTIFGTPTDVGVAPTSTVFTVGSNHKSGASGEDYIAYCFHSVENFSSFGSYTGNGTTTGPMVETGFEPAMIIIKDADGTDNWAIVDNKRATTNPRQTWLRPNLSNAEFSNTVDSINFYSNGFQIAGGTSVSNFLNENGNTFIYMAFAADPDTEAPTVAKSFSTVTYSGTGATQSIEGLGFSPSLLWFKSRSNATSNVLYDTVRGSLSRIYSDLTNAAGTTADGFVSFDSDGFSLDGTGSGGDVNASARTYVAWAWKADDNEPTILPNTELTSLISKYKFEDNANDDYADNNGTASNLSYVSGRFGKAADFNGSSSKILYPQAEPFNDSNTIIAVSAWVKLASTTAEFALLSASSTSDQSDVAVIYVGGSNKWGRVYLGDAPSNANEYQANFGSTNDTNWNHFVWQLSATNGIELWVNGVSQTRTETWQTGTMDETKWFGDLTYATDVQYATGINRVVTTAYYEAEVDQMRLFNAELTSSEISALYNEANEAIVSANANAGFSIVKYEGTGVAGATIGHGLSAAPEMVIIKNLDGAYSWAVRHSALDSDKNVFLNATNAQTTVSTTAHGGVGTLTSTTFGFIAGSTTLNNVNTSGDSYIAYCFHSVSGYSKFGSYTGTGTTNSITGLGFQPDWLMIKRATGGSSNGWVICDSVRGVGINLRADTSSAEADESAYTTSFDSDGFTLAQAGGNTNVSGSTYIYMAFKIN